MKQRISGKDGLECIRLGKEYDVCSWVKWGLSLLIQMGEVLDLDQLRHGGLKIETICALYAIREKVLFRPFNKRNLKGILSYSRYITQEEALRMVEEEEIFSQEFGTLDDPRMGGLSPHSHSVPPTVPWHAQDGAGDDYPVPKELDKTPPSPRFPWGEKTKDPIDPYL